METIRVVDSKWKEDDDVPWEGSSKEFRNWVYEEFLQGFKRDDVEYPSLEIALSHMRNQGYKIEVG